MGVVGAGRVGAVLAAALRAAGHEIVAAAGESDASRDRAAALLPGVPARSSRPRSPAPADLLLLTVPDDMLGNVVTMLSDGRGHPPGPVRRAHLRPARPRRARRPPIAVGARAVAMHPAMTFTGTAVDLDRARAAASSA